MLRTSIRDGLEHYNTFRWISTGCHNTRNMLSSHCKVLRWQMFISIEFFVFLMSVFFLHCRHINRIFIHRFS